MKKKMLMRKFGSGGIPEAQTFIEIALITDETQISAINQLVSDLQTYGLWDKLKAIYPFVGGTAHAHKFNLKDPRDLDEAFRLELGVGTLQHDSNGVLASVYTATTYNTNFAPQLHLANDSACMSFYSRTANTSTMIDMGTNTTDLRRMLMYAMGGQPVDMYNYTTGRAIHPTGNSTGFFLGNRTSNIALNGWRNGVKGVTQTSLNTTVIPSTTIHILSSPYYSNPPQRQCAFASIGDGLTDTEATDFYTIVQAYQTTLGRQV